MLRITEYVEEREKRSGEFIDKISIDCKELDVYSLKGLSIRENDDEFTEKLMGEVEKRYKAFGMDYQDLIAMNYDEETNRIILLELIEAKREEFINAEKDILRTELMERKELYNELKAMNKEKRIRILGIEFDPNIIEMLDDIYETRNIN